MPVHSLAELLCVCVCVKFPFVARSCPGRLYKAVLRSDLSASNLPLWVGQQSAKRADRRRLEDGLAAQLQQEGSSAAGPAGTPVPPVVRPCVVADEQLHDVCSSVRATSSSSNSNSGSDCDDEDGESAVCALRKETLVIKEVPFQGLPPQEQQDILNEVGMSRCVNRPARRTGQWRESEPCPGLIPHSSWLSSGSSGAGARDERSQPLCFHHLLRQLPRQR